MVRWLRDGPLREWACTTHTSQVVALVLLAPSLVALAGPVFGDRLFWLPPSTVIIGGMLAMLPHARTPAGYRELDPPARRRVRRTQYSGVPSGDEFIDWVAVQRQRNFAGGDTPVLLALDVVFLLGVAAFPVIAVTVRGASLWWLAAEVALLAAAFVGVLRFSFPSPRARLEILRDNLAEVAATGS